MGEMGGGINRLVGLGRSVGEGRRGRGFSWVKEEGKFKMVGYLLYKMRGYTVAMYSKVRELGQCR
jgi:hypothetical protein